MPGQHVDSCKALVVRDSSHHSHLLQNAQDTVRRHTQDAHEVITEQLYECPKGPAVRLHNVISKHKQTQFQLVGAAPHDVGPLRP